MPEESTQSYAAMSSNSDQRPAFSEMLPLIIMHLACLSVFFTGVSMAAIVALLVTYFARVFALTAGFHRYFSHKSYRTSRAFQFVLAVVGTSAAQLGPLWWASHHRWHHRYSDTDLDVHSPTKRGFWWSHMGWLMCRRYAETHHEMIRDFSQFPELRWLDRHPFAPPVALAAGLFATGFLLERHAPGLNTNGWQMLAWGFFLSTVLVYHVTFAVNSLMHLFGFRRYATSDTSRNNPWFAILSMGECWHNNHHYYAGSARQGFFWWELDLSYMVLKLLSWVRVVWDVRRPPAEVLERGRLRRTAA